MKAGSGGKRGKKHTDRALVSRWIRGVFLSSACESLDQKHTDRVFLSSACEPLDQRCVSFERL